MDFDEKYDWIIECAERINSYPLRKSDEEILLSYLDDENEIIRSSAIDLLGDSDNSSILKKIMYLAKKDSSFLVRAYCCASAIEIAELINTQEQTVHYFREALVKERSLFVRLAWMIDLAPFYQKEEITEFIETINKGLSNRNRHLRNLAVNVLLSNKYFHKYYSDEFILDLYKKEKCVYIRNNIQQLIMAWAEKVTEGA